MRTCMVYISVHACMHVAYAFMYYQCWTRNVGLAAIAPKYLCVRVCILVYADVCMHVHVQMYMYTQTDMSPAHLGAWP